MFLWVFFYVKINFTYIFSHKKTNSQFLRACSHHDVIVRSYIIGWYLFWYQWKEDVHSYEIYMTFNIDNPEGVLQQPPLWKICLEKMLQTVA